MDMRAEDLRASQEAQAAIMARIDAERRIDAARAAKRGLDLWRAASKSGSSPYLIRKRVADPGHRYPIRYLRQGALVIPMLRYDRAPGAAAFVGAQVIDQYGGKRFTRGCAKSGAALRLGPAPLDRLIICEGLATGLSIRQAIPATIPVYIAFDAGNLAPVARILRGIAPDAVILIAADDDPSQGNPGLKYARQAAHAVGADICCPPPLRAADGGRISDYNDWHIMSGIEPLREHFARIFQLSSASAAHAPSP